MSETLGRAVLELVANVNPLKAGLAEGKAASEEMAATSARSIRGGITKAAMPATLALGVMAIGIKKVTDAAQADQVSQARLGAAFKANHIDITKYAAAIDEAEKHGAQLGFQTNDTREAIGTLVTAFGDGKKALDVLGTAQDIARFKHIGLADAAQILTSASAGSTRAARQLGIAVASTNTATTKAQIAYQNETNAIKARFPVSSKQTAAQKAQLLAELQAAKQKYAAIHAEAALQDKQATSARVIDLVNKKLHGQADAFAKTAEGAKQRLGAETERLSVNLGTMLLPVLTAVTGFLSNLTGVMTEHATVVKVVIAVIAGLAAAVVLTNIGLKLYETGVKLATAAQWLWNAAMDANPLSLIILGLVALGVALAIAWKKSATFRAIVLGVWNDLKGGVVGVLNFFTHTIPAAFQSVLGWVKAHWPVIVTLISGPFAPIVALATNAFGVRSALLGAFSDLTHGAKHVWDGIASLWGQAWNGAWGLIKGSINLIIGGINTLIGAWDSLHFHFGGIAGIGAFDVGVPQIPKIPMLAQGGIVTKPTLAIVGEAGPEAVVPLSHSALLKHEGGAGQQVVINVNGVVGNPREVAVVIGRELEKLHSRGLSFNFA